MERMMKKDSLLLALVFFFVAWGVFGCSGGDVQEEKECLCVASTSWCDGNDVITCNQDCRSTERHSCAEGFLCVDGKCIENPDGDRDSLEAEQENNLEEENEADTEEKVEELDREDIDTTDETDSLEDTTDQEENEEDADAEELEPEILEDEQTEQEHPNLPSMIGSFETEIRIPMNESVYDLETYLSYYDRLFSAPCDVILEISSQEISLQNFYDSITDENGNPSDMGQLLCEITHEHLLDLSRDGNLLPVVEQIKSALATLRMDGAYEFLNDPHPDLSEEETWFHYDHTYITWNYGCEPTDEECGVYELPRNNIALSPINGHFEAYETEDTISFNLHKLPIRISLLVSYIAKEIILPRLFVLEDSAQEDIIHRAARLIMGGASCMDDDSCCNAFATTMTSNVESEEYTMYANACKTLMPLIQNAVESSTNNIDWSPTDIRGIRPLGLLSPENEPCPIYDNDGDGTIDSIGTPQHPCRLQMNYEFSGGVGNAFTSFYGVRNTQ